MADYISREALKEAFDNADADVLEDYGDGACDWGFGMQNIREVINSVPAADVEPVRHGRWVDNEIPDSMLSGCSACGFSCGAYSFRYCPNCGAKMVLEEAR